MTKPRIAIGMNFHPDSQGAERAYLDAPYLDMIHTFGAIPCPLAPILDSDTIEAMLAGMQGLLLTGGRDLNPELWHEPLHAQTDLIHPRRQQFDLRLYQAALRRQLPIFGICLGLQLICVAQGGALYQHLPESPGRIDHTGQHGLNLYPSRLKTWLGADRVSVPSLHHQGVMSAGQGLTIAGVADDGVIEAVEMAGYPFLLAVQWHPERHSDEPACRIPIQRFVAACRA